MASTFLVEPPTRKSFMLRK